MAKRTARQPRETDEGEDDRQRLHHLHGARDERGRHQNGESHNRQLDTHTPTRQGRGVYRDSFAARVHEERYVHLVVTALLALNLLDPHDIINSLSPYGELGIILIIFAETGLLFGFFLPGDSLLFTAGILAGQNKR